MEEATGKNVFYLLVAVGILVLVGAVIFFFTQQRQQAPTPTLEPLPEEQGLGSQLNQNPGSRVPETNPFQAETNPLGQGKTNPFEGGYKNPFD